MPCHHGSQPTCAFVGGFLLPFPLAAPFLQGSAASLSPIESEITIAKIDFDF